MFVSCLNPRHAATKQAALLPAAAL